METKNFQSRRLTLAERNFSKTLTVAILRKEFIMRLNNGESQIGRASCRERVCQYV